MFDYKNPKLPIQQRITDLLSRMTLEEKAAQTCMLRGVEYATKPSKKHNCSVEEDTDFDEEKLLQDFGRDGFGFVHDMYATPTAFNKIIQFALKSIGFVGELNYKQKVCF